MTASAGKRSWTKPATIGEKIAQLLMVRIGSNLPPVKTVAEDEERVARLLEACPVGGLCMFNGGAAAKSALERLQKLSPVPLLVGADIERGVGQQVHGFPLFPHAMAFGQLPGERAVQAVADYAKGLAHDAGEVGIHITFGPVADVNTVSKNPIVATRAFGEEPELVSHLVAAYVRAAQSHGLIAAAKHFPGHGHTDKDSHETLPTVTRSRDELEACELKPFRAAIGAGCKLLMTAHVAYPSLDPSGTPATYSPVILRRLLRKEFGFSGAVCSDSLLMAGARDAFESEGEMALAVLAAGVDLLLDVHDPAAVVNFLCRCIGDGRLSEARVDEALERVWALKEFAFAPAKARQPSQIRCETVAREAIRLIDGEHSPALPLKADEGLTAVLLKPFETPLDPPEQPLAAALRERFDEVRYVQLGPKATPLEYEKALESAAAARQLLIAVIVRPAAWHSFGLRPEQHALVRRITLERQCILVSLGIPYVLDDFPQAAVRLCTYSDVPASQAAVVDFLAGR